MVGMRLESGRQQRLAQQALRAGFDAHAAFFAYHVAFLVKLAKDGIEEALRLEEKPQLQAVAGKGVEVIGGVLSMARVQPAPAVFFNELRFGVGYHAALALVPAGLA